jgi:hypothetical protein
MRADEHRAHRSAAPLRRRQARQTLTTSFGIMTLRQEGSRIAGTYGREGRGSGWFRLRRPGCFVGEYLAEGGWPTPPRWHGWRGCDGLWDCSCRPTATSWPCLAAAPTDPAGARG